VLAPAIELFGNENTAAEKKRPFRISLNVSTISGFKLPLKEQIKLTAAAGFEGIELWMSDIDSFIANGGRAEDIAKMLIDSGLVLENIIAFAPWISNEPPKSAVGVEQMKREMELTAKLGGKHIAATGGGLDAFLTDNIALYGSQFGEIVRFGRSVGVEPLLELWGHGRLDKLWKVLAVATSSGCSNTRLLLDFYHLHAGENDFSALSLLSGDTMPVFHINDYPGDIPAATVRDADRVMPGDGVCPFSTLVPMLLNNGFCGAFSLELFNKAYWENTTPQKTLETGYGRVREAVTGIKN